jgi:hypothetical protein
MGGFCTGINSRKRRQLQSGANYKAAPIATVCKVHLLRQRFDALYDEVLLVHNVAARPRCQSETFHATKRLKHDCIGQQRGRLKRGFGFIEGDVPGQACTIDGNSDEVAKLDVVAVVHVQNVTLCLGRKMGRTHDSKERSKDENSNL